MILLLLVILFLGIATVVLGLDALKWKRRYQDIEERYKACLKANPGVIIRRRTMDKCPKCKSPYNGYKCPNCGHVEKKS